MNKGRACKSFNLPIISGIGQLAVKACQTRAFLKAIHNHRYVHTEQGKFMKLMPWEIGYDKCTAKLEFLEFRGIY